MRALRVAVLGGGIAGLATSLLLERDGHRVLLLEADPVLPSAPGDAFSWERRGVPHFQQPHALIPRARKELNEHFGDVAGSLRAAGAQDWDLRRKLPGTPGEGDEELQYLAIRRPLIEWGLRQAVCESRVEVRSGQPARSIRLAGSRVAGVEVDGGSIAADVVVNAMGRRSPMAQWLGERGHPIPPGPRSDCGVIYYSRYYRLRPGSVLPDGPWLLSPRGDLGYMAYASFPGDNGTFAAVLATPTGVSELKVFRDERAFEAMVARIDLLSRWTDPRLAEPITPVLPMGGLHNSLVLSAGAALPTGLFFAGDALCHTDPMLAHGIAFALIHAVAIAGAVRASADLPEAAGEFSNRVLDATRERYELISALDEQRLRMWRGEQVDFTQPQGSYELFTLFAGGAVAMLDPTVFRRHVRRFGLLESTRVLDDDPVLQARIATLFAELGSRPRSPGGPTREEALAIAQEAIAS